MKQRGCGCLALVLAAINAFVIVSVIVGLVQGNTNVGIGLAMVAVFIGNVVVCVMLALPYLRRGGAPESSESETPEDVAPTEGEED